MDLPRATETQSPPIDVTVAQRGDDCSGAVILLCQRALLAARCRVDQHQALVGRADLPPATGSLTPLEHARNGRKSVSPSRLRERHGWADARGDPSATVATGLDERLAGPPDEYRRSLVPDDQPVDAADGAQHFVDVTDL